MKRTDGFFKGAPDFGVTPNHGDILTSNALLCDAADVAAEACGLTMTQYLILVRLENAGSPLSMSDLAHLVLLGQSAVTAAVERLARMGALERLFPESDRRLVKVALLERGRQLIAGVDCIFTEAFRRVTKTISDEHALVLARRVVEVVEYYGIARKQGGKTRIDTAFFEVAILLRAQIEHALGRFGLSVNEYRILQRLAETCEGVRPGELADQLGIRANGITAAASRIVDEGYVRRTRDPLDRRAQCLEITSEGFAFASEVAPVVAGHIRHLHETDEDISEITDEVARAFAPPLLRWRRSC